MKTANKMIEWQRDKQYKQHVQRMRLISSPLAKKRSKDSKRQSTGGSASQISLIRNIYKSEQMRLVDLQNNRLIKKLSQIGNRRNKFFSQNKDQENYYTINMRSRQVNRRMKFQQIQQQNDLIVQRIMRKRNGLGNKFLLNDASFQSRIKKVSLKKSRRKQRNVSLILPKIQTTVQNVEQI